MKDFCPEVSVLSRSWDGYEGVPGLIRTILFVKSGAKLTCRLLLKVYKVRELIRRFPNRTSTN